MMKVLERQYTKYFDSVDIKEKLKSETKSARLHNIDAEEVMGMFSAVKKKIPKCYTLLYIMQNESIKKPTVDCLEESKGKNRKWVEMI